MKVCSLKISFLLLSILMLSFLPTLAFADQAGAQAAISSARDSIHQCFVATEEAETAGANVTSLLSTLNSANTLLSRANLAYQKNDFESAYALAVESGQQLGNLLSEAHTLRDDAILKQDQVSFVTLVGSVMGSFMALGAGIATWFYVSRKSSLGSIKISLAQHKLVMLVLIIAIALAAALPSIGQALLSKQSIPDSELWLLGQQHTPENYPFEIKPTQNCTVFLDAKNNLDKLTYYMIQVKFMNKTQYTDTASLPSLYNITAVIQNNGTWALPIVFSINYYRTASQINLNSINLNSEILNATGSSIAWDPKSERFFGYLYFELWAYNSTIGDFQNNRCSVDLRLDLAT